MLGCIGYLKHRKITDILREVLLAKHWCYTQNGCKSSDAEVQKCCKKFALLHDVKGFVFLIIFFFYAEAILFLPSHS